MSQRVLSKEFVDFLFQPTEPRSFVEQTIDLAAHHDYVFSADAGEAIAAYLMSGIADAAVLDDLLGSLKCLGTPLSRFVRARIFAYRGDVKTAIEEFEQAGHSLASPNAFILLHRSKMLAKDKRWAEAIADLQFALQTSPPYSFFVKSERLLKQLMASDVWRPRRRAKVAIMSSSTTALLAPVLRAVAFQNGLHLDIYEGVFGNYQQEMLDPQSGLYQFRPDLILMIPNCRDLGLAPDGGGAHAEQAASQIRALWRIVQERNPCHIVQVGFDIPCGGAWGSLEDVLPEGRRRVLNRLNQMLSQDLPSGVSYLDANQVAVECGPEYWSDAEWHGYKQYPSSSALPLFARHLCSHCNAALGLCAKVLVLDLDNTLWGGVIGEDLLGGIRLGPPSPEGEGYLELQQYAKELQQRGVLLAVCSKNNLADAERPFREHDAMRLKLEDFVAFVANWEDKAANMRAIAENLSLGLDSFVFLDDNPMERALVRSQLPQVIVPECGDTPWSMLAALRQGQYFQTVTITQEDRHRHQSYRSNIERKVLEQDSASLDDFLAGLEMVCEHGPVNSQTLQRVTQLINKTNQFNLTTRRYTEEQVHAMASSPDWWCHWFRLADRFSDYGLVGVILAKKEPCCWIIDTWLMSCRVLGRKMEEFMASCVLAAARDAGAEKVVGQYFPTEKNVIVQDLYPKLGFSPSNDQAGQFLCDLKQPKLFDSPIRCRSSATQENP